MRALRGSRGTELEIRGRLSQSRSPIRSHPQDGSAQIGQPYETERGNTGTPGHCRTAWPPPTQSPHPVGLPVRSPPTIAVSGPARPQTLRSQDGFLLMCKSTWSAAFRCCCPAADWESGFVCYRKRAWRRVGQSAFDFLLSPTGPFDRRPGAVCTRVASGGTVATAINPSHPALLVWFLSPSRSAACPRRRFPPTLMCSVYQCIYR
ncbi:uncharacterized protein B0T15DRAFT_35181 [Chaetomium strumarium]|uniref:Uncharacterized protein n=1 Tax=Chaetomium strumarium TaxID=1170767 RepID=A0AAJ0H2K2_9PEZI|nr:hypothetical protein B0T15DRAFT_35181 [Chaetomium strumarium]